MNTFKVMFMDGSRTIHDDETNKNYWMEYGKVYLARYSIDNPFTYYDILYNQRWNVGWTKVYFKVIKNETKA